MSKKTKILFASALLLVLLPVWCVPVCIYAVVVATENIISSIQ